MKLNKVRLKTNKIIIKNKNSLTVNINKIMERIWKFAKATAFILGLTAFVYVGHIMSQKGRYQPSSDPRGYFTVVDTQTGIIEYFSENDTVFHKIDFKEHTFN